MKQAKDLVAVLREANQVCKSNVFKLNVSKQNLSPKLSIQEIDPKLQAMAARAGSFGGNNRRYGGNSGGGNRSNFGTFKRGQISNGRGGNSGSGGYRGGQQNGYGSTGGSGGGSAAPAGHKRFN